MKAPFLLGRMIFGGFFLYNGINHIRNRKPMAQYTQSKGVPNALSEAAVIGTGVAMLAGGASIVSGVKPKWGALAILGFLGGVSPIMHNFWVHEDPQQRQAELINFTKNLAMAGAALALLGVEEPWEASVPIAQPSATERMRSLGRRLRAA
jgi:uncharacterized membrane protein YphA (DoxX/SURF4 family)